MKLHLLLSVAVINIVSSAQAAQPVEPVPSKYFAGSVSRDVASALKRSATEHRPVWIVAWDDTFFHSTQGRSSDVTDYALGYFYQNPETKKLVAQNFITVFTTLRNPAISSWIDASDKSHRPLFIVVDSSGKMLTRQPHTANPDGGLKAVQDAVAVLPPAQ
jgi:hypothetical protein